MKHILIIFSLLAVSLAMPAFAQDETASQESTVELEQDSGHSLTIGIDIDNETSREDKLKKVTDLISAFDEEIASELELELNGLSDEEKVVLVRKLGNGISFNPDIDEFPIGIVFIALPAVILIFGMPLFLLIALLSAGHRKRKQKMELVDLYIKSERDIPEHVIAALDNGGSASALKSGLTLTAVGVGIVASFSALGAEEAAGLGLIPMFLGIARLIFWYIVERKAEPKSDIDS